MIFPSAVEVPCFVIYPIKIQHTDSCCLAIQRSGIGCSELHVVIKHSIGRNQENYVAVLVVSRIALRNVMPNV